MKSIAIRLLGVVLVATALSGCIYIASDDFAVALEILLLFD